MELYDRDDVHCDNKKISASKQIDFTLDSSSELDRLILPQICNVVRDIESEFDNPK